LRKRPALEVGKTAPRYAILFHPGANFLASVGCFNPSKTLTNAAANIDFADSTARVIAAINDMTVYLGATFPKKNDLPIQNAWIVIDGEPTPGS